VSTSHLIGIDIGTTSVKAVMIDLSGRRVAEFSARYTTQRPAAGQVELRLSSLPSMALPPPCV
jgi:sugar (pentulose or hexulose) kinase